MHIREAVGVVGEKQIFAQKVFPHRHQPLTDVRVHSGVGKRYSPVRYVPIHQLDLAAAARKNEIVGASLFVVEKVLLDDVPTITETQDEVGMPIVSVVLHQMPEYWPLSDLYHRLRDILPGVAKTHAEATTKDHNFHATFSMSAASRTDVQRNESSRSPWDCSVLRRLILK